MPVSKTLTAGGVLGVLLACGGALPAAEPQGGAAPPAAAPAGGFDVGLLDKASDPCVDFYRFTCGGWIARNPVPPDQSRWGRFNELADRNRETLRVLLEKAAAGGPGRDAIDQKTGDDYASCMDETAIEAKGLAPLGPELDRIAALRSNDDLPGEIAHLHAIGVDDVLFGFGSAQDFKDATQVIAAADQGGLSLPDRDHYLKDDAKSAELRAQYVAHLGTVFGLLGESKDAAAADARTVMEIETALAKASLDRVSRRDPEKIYHKMARSDLQTLVPAFGWARYLEGAGAPAFESVNVTVPDFFKAVDALLGTVGLDAWKTYLRWHAVRAASPLLPTAFVNASFEFFGRALTGQKELRPRWKRCVDLADQELKDALGQRYVEATFGADGKARMKVMVDALERALGEDIRGLDWMTDATRKQALVKLEAIANKVGYPEVWRDYGTLEIVRGDALGNRQRASAFEWKRDLAKIGSPVDRKEWGMSPPTVNAYYSPLMNDINFPAGILQPPFFDRTMDDSVNFGAIGAVIGHELTHGFDDRGRQFAANGNLSDWWTEADAMEFKKRAQCVVDQYGAYTAVDDVKLNGQLTLGENVADNGGLRIARLALQDVLAGKETPPVDGFTPEQRFFLGWGQIWCQNHTEESARLLAQVDPHSPGRYRVNGVVSNMPEFQKAFGCKPGSPMVRENACRIW
jgi:endothelin-converting enzyme/putative endopeptidase